MMNWKDIYNETGSAVTAMMGGVAILAMLSFGTYQYMSGPLSSLSKITQKNIVDDQLLVISQIAALDAANLGDCDDDGFIEPRAWRDAAGAPAPSNGGLLPPDMGAPLNDPWGSEYGYCVWDTGATSAAAACGGASAGRLDGADGPLTGEGQTLTVYAIISPGPDRSFQTTCNNYVDATTDLITSTGDDIIQRYTYREASTATSSLWNLKTGFPDTAEIDKNLEIGSGISFDVGGGVIDALAINTSGKVYANGGLQLGDQTDIPDGNCTAMSMGLMRYNTTLSKAQVCTGAGGWVSMHAGGGLTFPISAPDGTSSAPSYSFTNTTASGMYLDASGNVEIKSPSETRINAGGNQIYIWDNEIYMETKGAPTYSAYGDTKITFTDSGLQPHFRLGVDGGFQIGDTTDTCAPALEGTIKYIAASDSYEFCDGAAWVGLPSVPVAPCLEDATNECELDATRENSDIDFLPENIKDGVNILGVTGTAEPPTGLEWDRGDKAVAVTINNTCAMMQDGFIRCVGANVHGNVGNGGETTVAADKFTNIYESGPWKILDGWGYANCGIKSDGSAWCWGSNTYGALGADIFGTSITVPVEVKGNSIWLDVSHGYHTGCGIQEDRSGWCWGDNGEGQFGNGATGDSPLPVAMTGGHKWKKIDVGWEFACGITFEGRLYCWGEGNNGKLGIGSIPPTQTTPAEISGGGEWLDVSTGNNHACAIKSDHTMYCWGNQGSGRLGNGVVSSGDVSSPNLVLGGHTWKSVTAGIQHTCGIRTDGQLYCWGGGTYGVLGNGSTSGTYSSPVAVSGGGNWLSVSAGYSYHTCGVKSDSTLWCWGYGQYNKTGLNNSETNVSVPTLVTEYQ